MEQSQQDGIYNYPYGFRGKKLGGRKFRDVARAGDRAPLFTIRTLEGDPVSLSTYLERGYVVLEFGSFT